MQQKKNRFKPALIISILPAGGLAIKTEACRRVPKRRLFLFSVNALQSCTLYFNNVFTSSSSNWFYCPWLTVIQGLALKVDKVSPEVYPNPDIPAWLGASQPIWGLAALVHPRTWLHELLHHPSRWPVHPTQHLELLKTKSLLVQ